MPPDGPKSWPKSNSKRQWLVFYRVNGMAMQGGGLIDGRGEKWWNLPCKPHKVSKSALLPAATFTGFTKNTTLKRFNTDYSKMTLRCSFIIENIKKFQVIRGSQLNHLIWCTKFLYIFHSLYSISHFQLTE